MRSTRLTAGLVALTALVAGGCNAGAQGPVGDPTVASVPSSTAEVTIVPVPEHAQPEMVEGGPNAAPSPTGTSRAGVVTDVTTDDVDRLLAGLDADLAGLDQLLNEAAAALAAEEGEIVP